jgi:uncharacterized protein (TIRG00374 family)
LRGVLRTILGIALAVGLLAIFLRRADLSRVWLAMQSARGDLVGLAFVLTLVMYLIRAERWQYLLQPLGHTRFWVAFKTTVIGFAASFVLPARAGELLRPYLLAREEGLPATAAFATVVVERLLDLVAVLILLGVFFIVFSSGEAQAAPALFQTVAWGGLALAPVGGGLLIAMFVMAGHPERLQRLVMKGERLLPSRIAHAVARLAKTFAEGLAVVRRPSRLVAALTWSLVLWLAIATQAWVLVTAFGITMPFGGSFLLTAMLVVGVSLPTPGGVGGTHEALRLGMTSFYQADNDAAVGAAILQHAVNFVPVILFGVWFIAREGLSLARLRELSTSARTAPDASRGETRRNGAAKEVRA